MNEICSFPPIIAPRGKILILGSMPGDASLRAQEYYAHSRNLFWPIMAGITGVGATAPYAERIAALQKAGISLWDGLASCQRIGSLDSAISNETPNDFASFFTECSTITHIFFNGAKAEQVFRRHVMHTLDPSQFQFVRLPSTSPAHATRGFEEKRVIWHAAITNIG